MRRDATGSRRASRRRALPPSPQRQPPDESTFLLGAREPSKSSYGEPTAYHDAVEEEICTDGSVPLEATALEWVKSAKGPYNVERWVWECHRLILLHIQNLRVLTYMLVIASVPAFMMYDETPVVLNILLDAVAVLFILDVDDVIYGVLLHEKLKDGLLTVGLSLPAQAKHAVRFSRFFHFHISWAVVIGSLMVVKWLPPELCHGAYIVLASCITMFFAGVGCQIQVLYSDAFHAKHGFKEGGTLQWATAERCRKHCYCGAGGCLAETTSVLGCRLSPRHARFIASWLMVFAVAGPLIVMVVEGTI